MTDTMPVKLSFFAGLIVAIIIELRNFLSAIFGDTAASLFPRIINATKSFSGEFFFFVLLTSITFVWIFPEVLYRNQNPMFQDIKKYKYHFKVLSFFGLVVIYLILWFYLQAYLVSVTPIFLIFILLFLVSIVSMNLFKLGKARDPTEIDSIMVKLEKIHEEIKSLKRV